MSDAEFIMRTVEDGVVTDTPITREEMFGGNLMSQTMPDALTQALARIEALEAETAISSGLRVRVADLEAQVRELQAWRQTHNFLVHGFPVMDNGDNAVPPAQIEWGGDIPDSPTRIEP